MKRRRQARPERRPIERAAIMACQAVYSGQCACQNSHAPSVCDRMVLAARSVLVVMAPEVAGLEIAAATAEAAENLRITTREGRR